MRLPAKKAQQRFKFNVSSCLYISRWRFKCANACQRARTYTVFSSRVLCTRPGLKPSSLDPFVTRSLPCLYYFIVYIQLQIRLPELAHTNTVLISGFESLELGIMVSVLRETHERERPAVQMDLAQRDGGAQRRTLATCIGVKADAEGHGKLGGLLSGKLGDNRYLVHSSPLAIYAMYVMPRCPGCA